MKKLDTVRFVPAKPAPSDCEETTYFVFAVYTYTFVDDNGYTETVFAGVVAQNGSGWVYYIDGVAVTDSYPDRCDLFNLIKQDPFKADSQRICLINAIDDREAVICGTTKDDIQLKP